MRRASAAVLLGMASAVAVAAETWPRESKTRSSANGLYAIRFLELEQKKCRVEVVKDREVAWQLDKCLAQAHDALFISNDGSRFWVLRVLPEIPEVPKGTRGEPEFQATLGARKLKDFLEIKRRGLVRRLGHHFKWLEGMADVPGKGPRVTDKNEVELEVVSSKTHRLQF
jgi:hypothetical protein